MQENQPGNDTEADNAFALAMENHRAGRLDDAARFYAKAVASRPGDPKILHNFGVLLAQRGQQAEAVEFFNKTLDVQPDHLNAHNNLANVCQELGRYEEALTHYDRCLQLQPAHPQVFHNKGEVHRRMGHLEKAASCYRSALEIQPGYYGAIFSLALISNSLGRRQDALELFKKTMELKSNPSPGESVAANFTHTNRFKICHDIQQFRYLQQVGRDKELFGRLAETYEKLLREVDWPQDQSCIIRLDEKHLDQISKTYNQPFHLVQAAEENGGSLNTALDFYAISKRYKAHNHGLTFVDDLLNVNALQRLFQFLLESTIWFDFRHINGHVAAYLENGLACPLVLQIAEDLRRCLPEIFGSRTLTQAWAFKNVGRQEKIDLHVDDAAVSVNFWITPDSANTAPESGGLIVYDFKVMPEHQLKNYAGDIDNLKSSIADAEPNHTIIPYRQNRAVIFNSDLYHKSDHSEFADGYENHRINVTFLYGNRSD